MLGACRNGGGPLSTLSLSGSLQTLKGARHVPWRDKQADGSSMASAFQGFRRRLLKLNSSHGFVGVLPRL